MWRSDTGTGRVVQSMIRVIACEATIHSVFPSDRVVSLSALAVANYFSLPRTRSKKKSAAVRLVRHLVDQGYLTMSDVMWSRFVEAPKRDDYADALLIALARRNWHGDKRPKDATFSYRPPTKLPPLRRAPKTPKAVSKKRPRAATPSATTPTAKRKRVHA
jgi:hypothetical protein